MLNEGTPSVHLYTLAEAAKLLASPGGRGPHPCTLARWIHKRRLKAYRVGGRWRVTLADLKAFVMGATQSALPALPPDEFSHGKQPVSSSRRIQQAEDVLKRLGI